jgi:hypothetical protein
MMLAVADELDDGGKLAFEELLESQVRTMRTFRRPARFPKVLAGLVRLGGRGSASFYHLIFLPRPSEQRYLNAIGVSDDAEGTAVVAMMMQAFTYWFGAGTLIFGGVVAPNLLLGPHPEGAKTIISQVLILIVMPALLTLVCALPGFTMENRLLASAFRAARLLRALSPDPTPSPARMTVETLLLRRRPGTHRRDEVFQLLLRNARHRRRVVAGVAWALTRDTARVTGRPPAEGATGGELLLWFAENPQDRRRRPIVSAHLAELMNAVVRDEPLPHAQFAPASRFRNRSPRERFAGRVRGLASGALVPVLVAVVTAVLRIWFK